jgi:hypothetical protein
MEPRSLFNLILKILGVFFIRNILEALSRSLSVLVYLPQYESGKVAFYNLGVTIPPLVLYTIFCWLLLFRTDSIVTLLKLDRLPGNNVMGLRVHRSVTLSLAIIIIGGWMLVNEIPEMLRHMVYYYQERKTYIRMARPDVSYLVMSLFKIFIALFLLVFNKFIVNALELKRKGSSWYWPVKMPYRRKKKLTPDTSVSK